MTTSGRRKLAAACLLALAAPPATGQTEGDTGVGTGVGTGVQSGVESGVESAVESGVGIVTFTVDNVTEAFFVTRMPAFLARDIPGTIFGQTQPITGLPGDMTWDDVRSLAGYGWEFGAHGYTHAYPLSKASDEVLEMELGVPAAQIYVQTGIYPITFASPFGDYDARVLDRVRFYYKAHFRGWGNGGINPFDQTDHWHIYREQVPNTQTVEQICAEMERAGRERLWLVYMWHRVVDTPTYEYENSVAQFEGVLDCADRLRDQGVIRLMTAREALEVVPHTPRTPEPFPVAP